MKRCCAQSKLGKGAPVLAAPAFIRRNNFSTLVEVILLAQEALNAGAEQFLFFRQLDIHPMPRAMWSETKNCFRDDVALDFIRPPVNAEFSGVQIFLRRRVPVVRPRHEAVGARRVLADRQAIVTDGLMR